ncbi:MAG: universal stress protein [Actinomycetales bacterium]
MTVVVGFITTKEGRGALARAVQEARLREAKLLVLRSSKPKQGAEDEAEQLLDETRAAAQGLEIEVRTSVRDSDPAEDLIKVATEEPVTMIVIGLRRRTPVGKLILGSNAQRVLLDAPCPVLAVKA